MAKPDIIAAAYRRVRIRHSVEVFRQWTLDRVVAAIREEIEQMQGKPVERTYGSCGHG